MSKSRSYCFTINNYSSEDESCLSNGTYQYLIYGRETAPETGTPHLQGYIYYRNAVSFASVKKYLGGAHIEPAKGNVMQNVEYCKKGGEFVEFGECPRQGKRTDIEEVSKAVVEGKPISEIAIQFPATYVKYNRGLTALRYVTAKKRDSPPRVVWLYGPTGSGKSRTACDCESFYVKDNTQWWDGYDFQSRIVIDDFRLSQYWSIDNLLRLLDRYPFQGQVKGGYVNINSPEIYITAPNAPDNYYHGEDLPQLLRRITQIVALA